jgi:hypothetical protein
MSGPSMDGIGKYMMVAGALLIVGGAVVMLLSRYNIPIGRLPGDIRIESENGSFYFPITSSILASVVFSILLNLIGKFLNK